MLSGMAQPMKKPDDLSIIGLLNFLAERTGLEPATPGVTGRYSNQLNYRSAAVYAQADAWRPLGDSNPCTHRERVMS